MFTNVVWAKTQSSYYFDCFRVLAVKNIVWFSSHKLKKKMVIEILLPSEFVILGSTILNKIFGTEWSNPVKLNKKRKVWYVFLGVF